MLRQALSLLLSPRIRAVSTSAHLPGVALGLSERATAVAAAGAISQRQSFASNSSSSSSSADATATTTTSKALLNKLLYRSRQRGFLELDLMVGLWAEQQLPHMNLDMLQHFSIVLDMENPDLFKWLTGQLQAPPEVQANPAFAALHKHVQGQLGQNSSGAAQAGSGREWVRGWDDGWKKSSGSPAS